MLVRVHPQHLEFRAQAKLTRAQARVGPGLDTPLLILPGSHITRSDEKG